MQAAQQYGDIVSALNGINNDIANEQQGILDQQRETLKSVQLCLRCMQMVRRGGLPPTKRNSASLMKTYGLADCLPRMVLTQSRGDDGVW